MPPRIYEKATPPFPEVSPFDTDFINRSCLQFLGMG